MSWKPEIYGKNRVRRNYSRVQTNVELPNLIEVQTKSFDWFVKEGLKELFKEISPIRDHVREQGEQGERTKLELYFDDYEFDEPKYTIAESKRNEVNYSRPLKVNVRLVNKVTGEIKPEKIFLGEYPMMTPWGTFIFNGAERVIVTQIIRSAGAFYSKELDKKTGLYHYYGQIIPTRGAWIEFELGSKDIWYAKLDRSKKIPFVTFLRAMGLNTNQDIINLYGHNQNMKNTFEKDETFGTDDALERLYDCLRPGENATPEGARNYIGSRLFETRRYDLASVGRFKVNKKLDVFDRINLMRQSYGKSVCFDEDILDPQTKEVLFAQGTEIDQKAIDYIREHREVIRSNRFYDQLMSHQKLNLSVFEEEANEYYSKNATNTEDLEKVGTKEIRTTKYFKQLVDEFLHNSNITFKTFVQKTYDNFRGDYIKNRKNPIELKASKIRNTPYYQALLEERGVMAEDMFDEVTGEVLEFKVEASDEDVVSFVKETLDYYKTHMDELLTTDGFEDAVNSLDYVTLEVMKVSFEKSHEKHSAIIVGNDQREDVNHVTLSDILAGASYYVNLHDGIGRVDDIDHLGNRRLRLIGELLQNQFRIGLAKMEKNVRDRMSTNDIHTVMPQSLINIKTLTSSIREFFGSSQLSQFMDQINPLSELTHKRRISALGAGGLTRDRAGFEVRDVHVSHYGRICPIETPEGQNIGLINSLATYARVDQYGFIETPYLKVKKNEQGNPYITDEIIYLNATEEEKYYIAEANVKIGENKEILGDVERDNIVIARHAGDTKEYHRSMINLIDVSPKQIVAVSTACIPFLEHDDANRALMGANMQRQAIPLLKPEAAFVATGIEGKAAADSGVAVVSDCDGEVIYSDALKVIVKADSGEIKEHILNKFERSNNSTCINQRPIVFKGERVKKGAVLADGASMDQGEMALGRNVVIAFMTWNGYNYEDAVIMNERLVQDDVYTSIHIEKYEIEVRDTKLGKEEITAELDNVRKESLAKLDEHGIIRIGAEVEEGDILVGKVSPKGQTDPTPEERLSHALFSDNSKDVRNSSLKVPHGGSGIVHRIDHFKRKEGAELAPGVNEVVRVFIVQKRKISEGDKMSGRHGNKGVISRILPQEDMPYLEDGTPVDIMLNPQGIPSRLNIGQVLEVHLGMAAKRLGTHIATNVFDGVRSEDLQAILKEAGMDPDGKTWLIDGRTGKRFDNRITVGVMYMIKLAHMVDDKLHARSEGPYTLVTQQPMGGKAQNGGQRFGEMEVWALEAYGAAYTLREMLTIKSDDIVGRNKVYKAIVDGDNIPDPGIPESFRVLVKELQGLGLSVTLIDSETGEDVANKSLVQEITQSAQAKKMS